MKRLGFFRNSTSSFISPLTWSMPSMSLNVSFWSPLLIRSSFAPPKILHTGCYEFCALHMPDLTARWCSKVNLKEDLISVRLWVGCTGLKVLMCSISCQSL